MNQGKLTVRYKRISLTAFLNFLGVVIELNESNVELLLGQPIMPWRYPKLVQQWSVTYRVLEQPRENRIGCSVNVMA